MQFGFGLAVCFIFIAAHLIDASIHYWREGEKFSSFLNVFLALFSTGYAAFELLFS